MRCDLKPRKGFRAGQQAPLVSYTPKLEVCKRSYHGCHMGQGQRPHRKPSRSTRLEWVAFRPGGKGADWEQMAKVAPTGLADELDLEEGTGDIKNNSKTCGPNSWVNSGDMY